MDESFDFTSQENIDCLVCHEQTGSYRKGPGGRVADPSVLREAAWSVQKPSRRNCGSCHFNGGGGDGVKHGDLDSSLLEPARNLDVHMSSEGAGFDCVRCHTTQAHFISGRCYKIPAFTERKSLIDDDQVHRISCVSCHTAAPHHSLAKLNDHTDVVACQTCHIPKFARELPTKMWWDWSSAGQHEDNGAPVIRKGELGKDVYHGGKGDFVWEKNVIPDYFWFNGSLEYVLLSDRIDPDEVVKLNRVMGSRDDPRSRIYPFKVHRGKLPYDTRNLNMLSINLAGDGKEAFWKSYQWEDALQSGMEAHGMEFSGSFDFIETEYHFPTTHMVAPREDSLQCRDCHSREGRLASLGGFYMPGRDRSTAVDFWGWLLVFLSVAGVTSHGLLRAVARRLAGREGE